MDRARDFHFVKQLPRTNVPEVEYSDQVFDRQVLLNETWFSFASRNGYPADVQHEEHVKWVTETWAEYLERVPQRSAALQAYFQGVSDRKTQENLAAADHKRNVNSTIARMMQQERDYNNSKVGTLHTLYVDFEAELLKKHAAQRASMEEAEAAARRANEEEEERERAELRRLYEENRAAVQALLDEQQRLRDEEEARIKEEQRRKAEELRRIEEEKQRLADEEARRKKEEEEEAKRAERRRKEEERRAKAKAEREARAGGRRGGGGGQAAAPQSNEEKRSASRIARWNRMATEMNDYVAQLQPRCDAVDSTDSLNQLYSQVMNELGGNLLFNTAVYVAAPSSPTNPENNEEINSLAYIHASENCSHGLKSGQGSLAKDDSRADGIAPVTFDSCVVKGKGTGIIRHAEKQLVNVGSFPDLGTGDFVAVPVKDSTSGVVAKIICMDTMTGSPVDATSTLTQIPAEEHVYLKNDGEDQIAYVAMPEGQGTFLEKVADCFGTAESRVRAAAAGGDSGAAAADQEQQQQQEEEQEQAKSASSVGQLNFDENSVNGLPQYFSLLSGHLHNNTIIEGTDSKLNVYISRLIKPDGVEATVVSQNGILLSDPNRNSATVPIDILGETLKDSNSYSFTRFKGADNAGVSHVYVPNVTGDDRVVLYKAGATKAEECLLLVPLKDVKGRVVAIVGCSCPAPPGLSQDLINQILAFVNGLQNLLHRLLLRSHLSQLCAQACEWVEITTGAPNVYIALKESALGGPSGNETLHYVAANGSQQWMIGKTLENSSGVSHAILTSPGAATDGLPINIPSVAGFKHEATGSGVHLFGGEGQEGALLCVPITNGGEAFGMVYADTVGPSAQGSKKKDFNKSDEDLIKTTGQLLGGIMGEVVHGRPSTPASDQALASKVLSIEELVGIEHIEFLKRVWVQVSSNIQNIKKDQLLEMSKYNSPPPVIPIVVGATFIVMGTKPKTVAAWEDARKKVKYTVLDKIVNYDPTATKVKKAFFQRARKMTKGHTADDVFTKGSYPASCFFTWTFVTILLRKSADALRKKVKAGELGLGGVGDDVTSQATDDTMGDEAEVDEGEDLPDAAEGEDEE